MKHLSGHESSVLSDEEMERIWKDFEGYRGKKLLKLSPGGWHLPEGYLHFGDKVYDFKFRSSDVVIMTLPKCGTTWMQEIVWTMLHNPNLDLDGSEYVQARSPFLEADMLRPIPQRNSMPKNWSTEAFNKYCPGKDPANGLHLQLAEVTAGPRVLKTHLPLSLHNPSLLNTAKVVYAARNPRDMIVSLHHHHRIVAHVGFVGSFEDYLRYFLEDKVYYTPFWLQLKEAWEKRNHPNLHFMFYEDMKEDPLREIKKLDAFLGINLTQAQLEGIVRHTSFKEMKTRTEEAFEKAGQTHLKPEVIKKEGGQFRKGIAGDWKETLTPEMNVLLDEWIDKNLGSLGIPFRYEL